MDIASAARALAGARCGIGLGLLIAPRWTASVWLGDDRGTSVRIAVQALGAREVAIGLGMLDALVGFRTDEARRWLSAGILGDLIDAAVTGFSHRPRAQRASVVALAAGGAATGVVIRSRL